MSLACPVAPPHMTNLFTMVRTVAIPVADQDRTRALLEQLGFTTTMDTELQPGFRWVELALAAGGTTVSLVEAGGELPAGIDTGVRLITDDARGPAPPWPRRAWR